MNKSAMDFELPPALLTTEGRPRRVGYELEFSGLTLDATTDAVLAALGGKLTAETEAARTMDVPDLGEFEIEIDWAFIKERAAEAEESGEANKWLEPLTSAATSIVPLEVVCPPIAIDEMTSLVPLVDGLRNAGATGTDEKFFAAYGAHINPEIGSPGPVALFAYLRAFSLLQWWLIAAHDVDLTRRLSQYLSPWPERYIERLLSRENPTMDQLIDDYLEFNGTRNRALDMLPMMMDIDQERISRQIDDPRIKGRPTFHYRLPNCRIDNESWSLQGIWNVWCVVERLANDEAALTELSENYLKALRPILGLDRAAWSDFLDTWLKDHELA